MIINKKSYCLLVTKAPFDSQCSYTAWRFADAVLHAGHYINQVFFYQQGTLNANSLLSPPTDEFNTYMQWAKLSTDHNVTLNVCVTASQRRGMLDKEESARHGLSQYAVTSPFSLIGMAEFFSKLSQCDRLVQF